MKSLAQLAGLATVLILTPCVGAQGFRGAATGMGRSAGPATFGSGNAQIPQSPSGSVTVTTAPSPAVTPAANGQIRSAPAILTPRVVPPVFQRGGVAIIPPNTLRRPPVAVIETLTPGHPPHRPHKPHRPSVHHHHHPGIVIVDSPYYIPNTVITEIAPGVVYEQRRYLGTPPAESQTRSPGQLAPFDPAPPEVVERMLRLATLQPGDLLYDLGAGDGRVVIAAAKKFGVKAVGFEIDAGLVKLARENVRKQGVEHLVEIRHQDFLTADLSIPSVVIIYLSYDGNLTVRPRLMSQLKTGARVVSYTFDMAEWQPKVTENYRDRAGNSHLIYLWEIGASLAFSDARR